MNGTSVLGAPRRSRTRRPARQRIGRGQPPQDLRVIFREQFFIVEPQVNLRVNLTNRLRLNWRVGYPLIGSAGDVNDRLRGLAGSVALQIVGGGS